MNDRAEALRRALIQVERELSNDAGSVHKARRIAREALDRDQSKPQSGHGPDASQCGNK